MTSPRARRTGRSADFSYAWRLSAAATATRLHPADRRRRHVGLDRQLLPGLRRPPASASSTAPSASTTTTSPSAVPPTSRRSATGCRTLRSGRPRRPALGGRGLPSAVTAVTARRGARAYRVIKREGRPSRVPRPRASCRLRRPRRCDGTSRSSGGSRRCGSGPGGLVKGRALRVLTSELRRSPVPPVLRGKLTNLDPLWVAAWEGSGRRSGEYHAEMQSDICAP